MIEEMDLSKRHYIFNKCLHRENQGRGHYVGLNRIWDFQLLPWWHDDGDHGFFEWGLLRCGWYPVTKLVRKTIAGTAKQS